MKSKQEGRDKRAFVFLTVIFICFLQLYLSFKYNEPFPALTYPPFARVNNYGLKHSIEGNEAFLYLSQPINEYFKRSDTNSWCVTIYHDSVYHNTSVLEYKLPNPWLMKMQLEVTIDGSIYTINSWEIFQRLNLPVVAKSKYIAMYSFYIFPKKMPGNQVEYPVLDIKNMLNYLKVDINNVLKKRGVKKHKYNEFKILWRYKSSEKLVISHKIVL